MEGCRFCNRFFVKVALSAVERKVVEGLGRAIEKFGVSAEACSKVGEVTVASSALETPDVSV
jgi:hypothetical protein